ncbi:MAG: tripartite tricarboxylate transporter substrate binding protein, partial [Burkholderiales bacterium]
VDNRGGASGNIGSNLVAKASADGYTLLFGTASTHTINPALFANLPFDPVRDFVPISLVAQIPNVLLVHPSLGVHSVQELIALARKKPGSLDYASSGNGTTTHLAGELFKMRTGVDIVHVPYKGSSAAIQDLVAGRISIMFENLPIGLKWVTAGRLIPLAVTGITRSPALPDVPTMQESGVADFNVTGWSGVFAPAATPPAIVAQIAESISEVMGVPAMREAFNANGAEVVASTPEQFSRQIKAEMAGWISVVRASGAKVD